MTKAAPAREEADLDLIKTLMRTHAEAIRDDAVLLADLGLRPDAANVVDFGPVALSRMSAAHKREASERQRLEAVARANYEAQAQTHAAVIDLMEARNLADLARRMDELARLRFGLAVGALALEGPGETPPGWLGLVEGQIDMILGPSRQARMGHVPVAAGLFGDKAPDIGSVAVVRLAMWRPARQGLMAFGAVDADAFTPDMGVELAAFLARVVELGAERWPAP